MRRIRYPVGSNAKGNKATEVIGPKDEGLVLGCKVATRNRQLAGFRQ
jgi:hypothetical protein